MFSFLPSEYRAQQPNQENQRSGWTRWYISKKDTDASIHIIKVWDHAALTLLNYMHSNSYAQHKGGGKVGALFRFLNETTFWNAIFKSQRWRLHMHVISITPECKYHMKHMSRKLLPNFGPWNEKLNDILSSTRCATCKNINVPGLRCRD